MKIHHISTLAANRDSNYHFYTQVLGLRLVKNTVNQENPRIKHLFYGDYLGSPGTVLTFFIIELLGRRTDGNHFIGGVTLQIPHGTSAWWATWLQSHQIDFSSTGKTLNFKDPDDFAITLVEGFTSLTERQINPTSPVPANAQIVRILGTNWAGPSEQQASSFFQQLINAPLTDHHRINLGDDQFIQLLPTEQLHQVTRFGRGSVDHLALQVANDDELFDYWRRAGTQGWQVELFRDRHWFKSIYIKDPNANRLELATVQPGFTVDEPLSQLGSTLILPPWLESRREEIEGGI